VSLNRYLNNSTPTIRGGFVRPGASRSDQADEKVAVKIQYPGIRQSLANDFKMFRALSKPAQASGHIPKGAIDEVEKQIVAETDYRKRSTMLSSLPSSWRRSLCQSPAYWANTLQTRC
jgi:predicted unusual protein kinase regulating ubiquinone biosynthesis (AarF/ABC1/UbiB family)